LVILSVFFFLLLVFFFFLSFFLFSFVDAIPANSSTSLSSMVMVN